MRLNVSGTNIPVYSEHFLFPGSVLNISYLGRGRLNNLPGKMILK